MKNNASGCIHRRLLDTVMNKEFEMHASVVRNHFQVLIIILCCEAAILSYVIEDTKLVPKFSNVDTDIC